jgi:hypothetical protein
VGLLDRLRRRDRPGVVRSAGSADLDHLRAWAGSRRGVEGFVEPRTSTTSTTLVLVASDGEWTRRRVDSPQAAFSFGTRAAIPVYDVAAVGYPPRMREWTAQRRAAGDTGVPPAGQRSRPQQSPPRT